MVDIVCEYIPDDGQEDDSIIVFQCSLNESGYINTKKPISGKLSENGEGTLFNGYPKNPDIILTWETDHPNELILDLLSQKILVGTLFSRTTLSRDDEWSYVIKRII